MRARRGTPRSGARALLALLVVVSPLLLPLDAGAQSPAAEVAACLTCHGNRDLSLTLLSGETRPLHVDDARFAASVHGNKLRCTDCHADIQRVPHEPRRFETRRQFTVAYYEQCKRCHFANYTKTLDSVHYGALERGDRSAPLCVDCHGSHDMSRPGHPRSRISETCATCHAGVSATYIRSVHGRALVADANGDVPVCTDCHRSHAIAGPRATGWLLRTPALCGGCHTNEEIMGKYGLSTRVFQTYLSDFHGMTASVRRPERADASSFTALCIDCHGVHDITSVKDPNSRVIRTNLVKTCRQCHADATENFPAAWLSHYEPSWQKAPLVYGVKLFYTVFIPFVVGGLLLQIVLHLWRVVANR